MFNRLSPETREDPWVMPADGSGAATQLLALPGNQWPSHWPHDTLVLLNHMQAGNIDLHVWDPTGQAPPRPYLDAPWGERDLQLSPDGRLAAFAAVERGEPEIYVREFPVPENKWRLTTGQSAAPRWSRDGQYLWWTHGGGGAGIDTVYRARVEDPARGRFGPPEVMHITDIDGIANWDLHPDGHRFVLVVPMVRGGLEPSASGSTVPRFLVALNWFAELRRQIESQGR